MPYRICPLLLAGLFLTSAALGQVRLRGVVNDSDTGDPIPGATIQVEGEVHGVVTNQQGRFFLIVNRIPSTLIFRHIGYRTRLVVVDEVQDQDLSVSLDPVVLELAELVVSGEDPAVGIMRRVLAQKQRWRSELQSAYAEVYTRFWLFRQFKPVQMSESIRSSYWRPESGNRELIRAHRVRPRGSGTFRFAGPTYIPNFYDDQVDLNGSTYVTPLHPKALDYYRFRLGQKRKRDDTIVWDIYFTPLSGTRTAFTGRIAILDSVFVALEIEVRPHPGTVFLPPVETHDVRFVQHFVELPGGGRVPLDLLANGSVTFGRLGASYPPARYEQVSSISNYAVNVPTPDSMFEDSRTQRLHPLADHQDFLFVRNPTIIPLTPREAESLAALDPRMTIERAFRPEGFLRAYTAIDLLEEEGDADESVSLVEMAVRHAWLWYNRVDGWHPGLQTEWRSRSGFRVSSSAGYASDRRKPTARVGIGIPWSASRTRGEFFLQASDVTEPVAGTSLHGLFLPGLMTYAGYDEYYDFYRNRGLLVGGSISSRSESIRLSVTSRLEKHLSVSRNAEFEGSIFHNKQRENPPIPEGVLASLDATLKVSRSGQELEMGLEHASSGWLNADFDYTVYRASATIRARTFFRDRERPNEFRLRLSGMTSSGDPPAQRYGRIDGSTGPFARSGGFRTLGNRALIGSRLAAVFWEHDFTTTLLESLGLWGLADTGSGLILFGGHGRIFRNGTGSDGLSWRHEMGVALTYPFRLPIRLDFSLRLDEPGFGFRLGRARL